MLRIRFSDIDWQDSDGKIIKMSIPKDFYTNARLSYAYLAPIVTEDTWAGATFPVQKNIWECYKIEFAVKEMAIPQMAKIEACTFIEITDSSTNETIVIDTQINGGITIEPGERYETTNQYFTITCRARKIKTYPGIAKLNTNNLQIIANLQTFNFYTDQKIIDFVTDAEQSKYTNNTGIDSFSKTISKNGKRMVFYLMESAANDLKRLTENIGYTSLKINPNIENYNVLELGKVKQTEMTEGLWKCECEFIISPNLKFA
jgi:hypothetical protein